jgi:hypothetical protein
VVSQRTIRITTQPDELTEGLFGQVILFVFEILPYLYARQCFPDWDIRSRYYGGDVESTIPGVLDLAYRPLPAARDVPLAALRERHCAQLGNDWQALHRLWTAYFRIPDAITAQAEALGPLDRTLGVHYRGTDKLTATWDTNPVARGDMAAIVRDMLRRRPELEQVFVASDDDGFAAFLRDLLGVPVVNLGPISFHKSEEARSEGLARAQRAMLDCVVLSRCRTVLNTSSALSSFTKVLSPELEIYRCAASKKFADIPYFPVAYTPPYQSDDPEVAAILTRLMEDDWEQSETAPTPFRSRPRHAKRALKWAVFEAVTGSLIRAGK